MSENDANEQPSLEESAPVDPAQLQAIVEQLRSQQNLAGGVLAGLVAAAVGAATWAIVTVMTGYQIGWMAVGVGFLVGMAVRTVGKGIDSIFGIAGALLAFAGCAAGNLLTVCGVIATEGNLSFMEVLSELTPSVIQELMIAKFDPMDLLFYGIAIYEGYKLSFRELSEDDMAQTLTDA